MLQNNFTFSEKMNVSSLIKKYEIYIYDLECILKMTQLTVGEKKHIEKQLHRMEEVIGDLTKIAPKRRLQLKVPTFITILLLSTLISNAQIITHKKSRFSLEKPVKKDTVIQKDTVYLNRKQLRKKHHMSK